MQQVVEEPEVEDDEVDETDEEHIDVDDSGQQLTYVDNSSLSWRVIACQPIRQKDPQQ